MVDGGCISQPSDFDREPAASAIWCSDGVARGAESAFAIGELDFGGVAALLIVVCYAAQFVGFSWRLRAPARPGPIWRLEACRGACGG